MPNDLCDAVIAQLRATPAVVSAFGDTWVPNATPPPLGTGTSKFYADFAADFNEPYLVVFEIGETYDYMTEVMGDFSFTSPGQFGIEILAPGRYQARQLGFLVAGALNDSPLDWTGGTLMMLRLGAAAFVPVPSVGPSIPTVFKRVLTFNYMYSGSIA